MKKFSATNIRIFSAQLAASITLSLLLIGDVFMDWGKIERPAAIASYESGKMVFSQDGGVPEDGLRLIIDQAQKSLKIAKPVALDEVADFTVLREAQKELGLR